MGRQVRGMLFVDYVRMLRAQPDRAWTVFFPSEDLRFLEAKIDANGWYPMATFERLGIVVLHVIAKNEFSLVREWGRASVASIAQNVDQLVVAGDPRESLMRFQVFRRTFFDFEALSVLQVSDGAAQLQISYGMSSAAEQAAAIQTMGFFEGLIDLARGRSIKAGFSERSWEGDPHTVLNLSWEHPATSA
jgi:hypothetical protein